MKTLYEHLLNYTDTINESFESSIVRNFFAKGNNFANHFSKKYVLKSYQWDKMTDDDFTEMTPEEALKISRSTKINSNGGALILWVNNQNAPVGISRGVTTILTSMDLNRFLGRKQTIYTKTYAEYSNKAYVITDAWPFDTADLKRARSAAKANALALKQCEEIAEENRNRYRALLDAKKFSKQDVWGWIDKGYRLYRNYMATTYSVLKEAVLNPMNNEEFRRIVHLNVKMSNLITNIMNAAFDSTSKLSDAQKYIQMNIPDNYSAKWAKEEYDRLEKYVREIESICEDLF